MAPISIDQVGTPSSKIPVELSVRFLEHFSESLYSSPQKAFEELVSNAWDAGADCVDIRIPDNLSHSSAALCVYDNGASMNKSGLADLWHIAFSPKEGVESANGRPLIGKFGIGKLSTYVLAKKLTYVCKSSDGQIRKVTMDYGIIQEGRSKTTLINDFELDLCDVTEEELMAYLNTLELGDQIVNRILNKAIESSEEREESEFGGPVPAFVKPTAETWTLAVLTDLKPEGRRLKRGVLKRMLEAALPIGANMQISINGESLQSSKIYGETQIDWQIGPDLGISEISLQPDSVDGIDDTADGESNEEVLTIKSGNDPVPYVELPEVGKVYGRVRLFRSRISRGKSSRRGDSNGFHVNVVGRVINQNDPSFGEENLSHSAWSKFRMAVRADGLNVLLTTDREKLKAGRELMIFRAFLRKVFNRVRSQYDSDENVMLPDGGDILVKSLGVISLNPLRNVVSERLKGQPTLPGLFDDDVSESDRERKEREWWEKTSQNISSAVNEVKYGKLDDGSLVKFRLSDSSIVVNSSHPFVEEHSHSKAEKGLMRTIAMVDLLTDFYAIDSGINVDLLVKIRTYRDKLLRHKAMQKRSSGAYIASLLLDTQNNSENSEHFEVVVGDALEYLGFDVRRIGKSGEPEGIASAYPIPTRQAPTRQEAVPPLYKFTYDAKSSKYSTAKTGNLCLDGINEHKERYKADHALVVAPGFAEGAVVVRCEQQGITPITGKDLGRLLHLTFRYGALPLVQLRELFQFHDPDDVSEWVEKIEEEICQKRILTIAVFLDAIRHLRTQVPDSLAASQIALTCRNVLGVNQVTENDVLGLVQGLSILASDLIGLDGKDVVINVSADRLSSAIQAQLEEISD